MKNFKVVIEIEGLAGKRTMERTIKAKTAKSAENKAWDIIGNQSGNIISIQQS